MRSARTGLLINAALALIKLLAGIFGHSYALVADALESTLDVFSSLIVWGGLRISTRSADERYPFGYGKAEPLATVVVGVPAAGRRGRASPSRPCARSSRRTTRRRRSPWWSSLGVVFVKEILFRRVFTVGQEVESTAVQADAWHHRSDAITSAAAALGIAVALIGGPGWEEADDWAALVAAAVILFNGVRILRPAVARPHGPHPGPRGDRAHPRSGPGRARGAGGRDAKVRRSGLGLYRGHPRRGRPGDALARGPHPERQGEDRASAGRSPPCSACSSTWSPTGRGKQKLSPNERFRLGKASPLRYTCRQTGR